MKKTFYSLTLLIALLLPRFSTAQNLYGTLENWHSYTASGTALEAPENWYGTDSVLDAMIINYNATPRKQLTKSASAHGGSFAATIVTKDYEGSLHIVAGVLVNARPLLIPTATGSYFTDFTPVTTRVTGMSAWIKYAPATNADSGFIRIQLLKSGFGTSGRDSVVGEGTLIAGPMANYTRISVPVTYVDPAVVPDKMLIFFASSPGGSSAAAGSTMTIDDVVLNAPSGIAIPVFGQGLVRCYPNPCSGMINWESASAQPVVVSVYNMAGQPAGSVKFSGTGKMDLQSLADGVYLYRAADEQGCMLHTGRLILKR